MLWNDILIWNFAPRGTASLTSPR